MVGLASRAGLPGRVLLRRSLNDWAGQHGIAVPLGAGGRRGADTRGGSAPAALRHLSLAALLPLLGLASCCDRVSIPLFTFCFLPGPFRIHRQKPVTPTLVPTSPKFYK